nr:MAG TPA: hypothetical protein [Caudoviricetes sp.]
MRKFTQNYILENFCKIILPKNFCKKISLKKFQTYKIYGKSLRPRALEFSTV